MAKKLFVGNLAWEVGSEDLKEAFSKSNSTQKL